MPGTTLPANKGIQAPSSWLKNTGIAVLLIAGIALCTTLSLSACDPNRAARETAQRQLTQQQTVLNDLHNKQDGIRTEIAAQERELASQQRTADEIRQRRAGENAELLSYLSEHKAAAAAVGAAGVGAVVLANDDVKQGLDQNVGQGSSEVAVAAGVLGAGYCLFNGAECTEVASKIAANRVATKDASESLQHAEANITTLQRRVNQLKQEAQDYAPRVEKAEADLEETQKTIQKLHPHKVF